MLESRRRRREGGMLVIKTEGRDITNKAEGGRPAEGGEGGGGNK